MKKSLKKLTPKAILLYGSILVIVSFGVTTLARYVIEEFHGYYLNAKHFYFTSNRLKRDNPVYLVNNWSGVGSFNISFDILSQKNEYVYTEYDIPYTVTFDCPNDVTCSVDKPSSTVYSASSTHSDTVTLSINPSRAYNENEHLIIDVTAQSTSPYVETITARFEYVVGKQGATYEIDDEANQVYLHLKITNATNFCKVTEAFGNYSVNDLIDNSIYRTLSTIDQAKCISKYIDLSFNPNILLIDTTENIIDESTYTTTTLNGTDYINSLSTTIAPLSTVSIKFYKVNPANDYAYPFNNNTSIINVNIHD